MDVKEKCAIAAVAVTDSLKGCPLGGAAHYLYKMLLQEQNRGQLSAGITTYNKDRRKLLLTYKDLGTVNKVFRTHHKAKNESIMRKTAGNKGIGHVRYSTCGEEDIASAHPVEKMHGRKWKWFALGFNGNIANFAELKKQLIANGYHLVKESDTEAIMHYIAKALSGEEKVPLEKAFKEVSEKLDGAYCFAFISADGKVALIRDPYGFKPLVYGKTAGIIAGASESAALTTLGIHKIESLQPGNILIIEDGKIKKKCFAECKRKAHCMFEWVYFANVASVIDDSPVYEVRRKLGTLLAKRERKRISRKDCIVVPVPDSAKPAGDGYAEELGLSCQEGLIRNRYIGRTFIEGSDRAEKVRDKFTINKAVLEGKKVFLVEDSIVRGTTCRTLIDYIKKEGKAKEVHIRVSAPPIIYPCFYGIDMSTMKELAVNQQLKKEVIEKGNVREVPKEAIENVRKLIKADSLIYQSLDDLIKAIGKPEKELCTACLSGNYPTPYGEKLMRKALEERGKGKTSRTYE